MRNPEIKRRSNSRKSGRVVNTVQELWFRNGSNGYSEASSASRFREYDFTTSDYTADTRRGTSCYRIDVEHNLSTQAYLWDVIKTNDSGSIEVFDYWKGEDELEVWFVGNSLDIKITVSF